MPAYHHGSEVEAVRRAESDAGFLRRDIVAPRARGKRALRAGGSRDPGMHPHPFPRLPAGLRPLAPLVRRAGTGARRRCRSGLARPRPGRPRRLSRRPGGLLPLQDGGNPGRGGDRVPQRTAGDGKRRRQRKNSGSGRRGWRHGARSGWHRRGAWRHATTVASIHHGVRRRRSHPPTCVFVAEVVAAVRLRGRGAWAAPQLRAPAAAPGRPRCASFRCSALRRRPLALPNCRHRQGRDARPPAGRRRQPPELLVGAASGARCRPLSGDRQAPRHDHRPPGPPGPAPAT